MANSSVVGLLKVVLAADTAAFNTAMSKSSDMAQEFARTGQKLADSLKVSHQKIVLGAHSVVEAMGQMNGQLTLTASEAQRWQAKISAAMDVLKAEGRPVEQSFLAASAALQRISEQAEPVQSGFAKMTARIKETAIGYAAGMVSVQAFETAGRKVIEFLKESVGAYLESEKVQRQMVAALNAQGFAIPGVIRQFDALAKKYQDLTVNDDEAIKSTEALLTQVGDVMPSQMDAALKAVTNLSSGLGIDLRSATMLVSKAFEDNFSALKKAGITIDEARAKSEGMSYVLDEINRRFGGQAQAEAESYAGQIKQIENAFQDFKEEIGRTIVTSGTASTGFGLMRVAVSLLTDEVVKASVYLQNFDAIDMARPGGIARWIQRSVEGMQQLKIEMQQARDAASGLMTVGPAGLISGHSATAVDEYFKTRQKKLDAENAAAEKAFAERLKKLQAIADQWNGRKLTEQMTDLADAMALVNKQGGILPSQLRKAVDQILDLERAGLKLPPVLAAVVDEWNRLEDQRWLTRLNAGLNDTNKLLAIQKENYADLLKLPNLWASNFKVQGGVPLAPSSDFSGLLGPAPDSRFSAERLAQRYAAAVAIASQVTRTLGETGSKAWRGIMQGAESATNIIGQYIAAGKTAAAATSAIWAGVTMGFSFVASAVMENIQRAAAYRAEIKRLKAEIMALGAIPVQNTSNSWQDLFMPYSSDLKKQLDLLKQITGAIDKLGAALEPVGNFVPPSLKPFLDELLATKDLPTSIREGLEGLATSPSWKYMQERAEALGVDLAALGPKFQQSKLGDIALGYVRDLEMFKAGGADINAVLVGMQDELSALASQAIKNKTILPASLKPYLDSLSQMGLLIDENGQLIDSGALSFKEMDDEVLKGIRDLLGEIKDLLSGITAAATAAGTALASGPSWGGLFGSPATEPSTPSSPTRGHMPGFARGTMGQLLNFGSGTPVMLHGWEGVFTQGDLAGALGGNQTIVVNSILDGRQIAQSVVRVAKNHGTTRV